MIKQYFQQTIAGIEAKLSGPEPGQRHRKTYALEIARLGLRLYARERPVAACGVAAPFEVLNAMGVSSCYVEFVSGTLSAAGIIAPALEEAEQRGLGGDACGYHRAVFGATHQGLAPRPDFLIATTCPCTGGLASIQEMARFHGKDLFVLNVPQVITEAAVENLAGQLRSMVQFIEAHTGEPLQLAALERAVAETNRTRAMLMEVNELAARRPSPVESRDLHNLGIVMPLLFGTPAATAVAQTFRDELAARVAEGSAPQQRLRLLWIQNRIQFKNDLLTWLEAEHQATVVAEEFNNITWDALDPGDPFPSLARRMMSFSLNGPAERRIEQLQLQARENEVHGAINPCHWGCRQGTGARGLIAEGLREIGVPVLNLEVDCIDPRNFAPGQLKTRMGAFAEMLAGRA